MGEIKKKGLILIDQEKTILQNVFVSVCTKSTSLSTTPSGLVYHDFQRKVGSSHVVVRS